MKTMKHGNVIQKECQKKKKWKSIINIKVMLVALSLAIAGIISILVALSTSKSISDTHSILINKRYIETQSISDNDKKLSISAGFDLKEKDFFYYHGAAIKNNNRFLQIYDNRWKCWLFPYFRSTQNNNKENIDLSISNLLKIQLSTKYIAQAKHCKYSVSDGVYKIYNHKLYMIRLDELPEYMDKDEFEIGDKVFKWLSIGEMEEDFDIMSKNDDVIAFVKKRCC